MNFEFCDAGVFAKGSKKISQGGSNIKLGVAEILMSRDAYEKNSNAKGGVKCSDELNRAIKKLQEDPYLCLDLQLTATGSEIKKSYRKLALKYHPDKNPSTSLLFTAIQDAYDVLSNDESKNVYDIRRRRQEASMDKLRKQRGQENATKPKPKPTSTRGSGNSDRPYSAKKRHGYGSGNNQQQQQQQQQQHHQQHQQHQQQQQHQYRNYSSNTHSAHTSSGPQPTPFPDQQPRARAGKMPTPRGEWGEREADLKKANQEATNAAERLRQFNRKFYQEFRQNAQNGAYSHNAANGTRVPSSSTAGSGAGPGGQTRHASTKQAQSTNPNVYKQQHQHQAHGHGHPSGSGGAEEKPQAPPKPKNMKSTHRDDTSVTLCWDPDQKSSQSVAYELQWRKRGKTLVEWNTAAALIVGTSCRKKNLERGTCYEFRVRAASAWGWSGYSETVMVVTLNDGSSVAEAEKMRQAKEKMRQEQKNNLREEADRAKQNVDNINARRRGGGGDANESEADGIKRADSWAWRREEGGRKRDTPSSSRGIFEV